jgi:hypothetical protein
MSKQWRRKRSSCFICTLLGRMLGILMRHDFATDDTRERYVVEVDGRPKAEYRTFAKALTAGLQFRQEFPNSHVKLRDMDEETEH